MSQCLPVELSDGMNLDGFIQKHGGSPAEYDYMNVLGSAGIGELMTAAELAGVDLDGFAYQDPESFEDSVGFSGWSEDQIREHRERLARQQPWFPVTKGVVAFDRIRVWCDEHPDALEGNWGGLLISASEDIAWGLRRAETEGVSGFRIAS